MEPVYRGETLKTFMVLCAVVLAVGCGGATIPASGGSGGDNIPAITPEVRGDFEQLNPNTGTFVGWVDHSMNYSVFQTDDSVSGKALRLYRPSDAPDDMEIWMHSDRFDVTPGVDYELSMSVKEATPRFRVEVAYFDDLNQCVTDAAGACVVHGISVTSTPGYTQFSGTSHTPAVNPPRQLRAEIHLAALDSLYAREFTPGAANMARGANVFIDSVTFTPLQ